MNSQWVSVDDHLPDNGDIVDAKYEGVYECRESIVFWVDPGGGHHFGVHCEKDGKGSQPATHWRKTGSNIWIETNKKLPQQNKDVLCAYEYSFTVASWSFYAGNEIWDNVDGRQVHRPLYWMAIPDIPVCSWKGVKYENNDSERVQRNTESTKCQK